MFRDLAGWIASTAVSRGLQNALWVIPTSQSIHLIAIGIVFGSSVVLSLRLLGIGRSKWSIADVTQSLLPWLWGALAVLLLTGIVQTLAEPGRQLNTPHFRWKMVMVVLVSALTWAFQRSVRGRAAEWDAAQTTPAAGKLFALLSLSLWVGIIICGRMIAYVWERYA
jgi:hypothetical protein